ncbi:MAG: MOSC domain-containing protein [Vicingaceae bacterium]|nr:MOSC domain-containing protein [Vicingaceae bacterium]
MRVLSTNIARPLTVIKNGKSVETGIYKTHIEEGITLGLEDVVGDIVVDRKHHGGINKACYLYSADHYPFWQSKFPGLDWAHGMFGENLTIEGLNEAKINIGDAYEVGTAIIQVSEPRRPCSILGIRFGTQAIVKEFYHAPYPGIYVRVLQEGKIKKGDTLKLIKQEENSLSVSSVYSLFASDDKNHKLAEKAIKISALSEICKNSLRDRFKL